MYGKVFVFLHSLRKSPFSFLNVAQHAQRRSTAWKINEEERRERDGGVIVFLLRAFLFISWHFSIQRGSSSSRVMDGCVRDGWGACTSQFNTPSDDRLWFMKPIFRFAPFFFKQLMIEDIWWSQSETFHVILNLFLQPVDPKALVWLEKNLRWFCKILKCVLLFAKIYLDYLV